MKKIIACLLSCVFITAFGCTCFAGQGKPSWFPEDLETFEDFHDENAPRIVDEADVLSDDEEQTLLEKINDITDATGFDLVIYTTPTSYDYGSDRALLARDFYQFNGYGYDEEYSGSVFMICFEEGNRGWESQGCGLVRQYFTEENINALDDYIDSDMRNGNYYEAMLTYTDKLSELYSNGTLVYEEDNTVFNIIVAAVLALIIAAIVTKVLYSGMKKVKIATNADLYIVPGSEHIRVSRDHFLYIHTRRVLRENNSNKGGSTFSGGSSSGGRSFSGGGRSF